MKQLTLGSLFDGIGGFCYAAGIPSGIDTGCTIKPLWAAEVEPNCIDITRYRFKDVRGDTPLIVTDKKAFEENQHGGYRETQINGTLRAAGGVLRRRVGNSDNREYKDKGEYP